MPFPLFRFRHVEFRNYCPSKKHVGGFRERISTNQICPSCVLPIVVAFILLFTVSQLIVIHRTILSYKQRNQAFEECFGTAHHENDSKVLVDLAFSKNFISVWPNASSEWKAAEQSYPIKLPVQHILEDEENNPNFRKENCPENSPFLSGNNSVDINKDVTQEDIVKRNPNVLSGGEWSPRDCRPNHKVAIIIPYSDTRWKQLQKLLWVLHPMLQRQMVAYQIFVIEQNGNNTFNKGVSMNAAFLLAMNASKFNCVIFHDVEFLPEDDRNLYGCQKNPLHLSVAVDKYEYRLPYASLVGGVFAIKVEHFLRVNGYSNLYWFWGGEDDDMFNRLVANHMKVNRPSASVARYKMLPQIGPSYKNPQFISRLIRTAKLRYTKDGLTTCKFRLVNAQVEPLFTHFVVDVGQPTYFVQVRLKLAQSEAAEDLKRKLLQSEAHKDNERANVNSNDNSDIRSKSEGNTRRKELSHLDSD